VENIAQLIIHGIKGDAWFGSMKAVSVIGVRGHQAVLQVKGVSGLNPKSLLAMHFKMLLVALLLF